MTRISPLNDKYDTAISWANRCLDLQDPRSLCRGFPVCDGRYAWPKTMTCQVDAASIHDATLTWHISTFASVGTSVSALQRFANFVRRNGFPDIKR
jgi:hypothetical protein